MYQGDIRGWASREYAIPTYGYKTEPIYMAAGAVCEVVAVTVYAYDDGYKYEGEYEGR